MENKTKDNNMIDEDEEDEIYFGITNTPITPDEVFNLIVNDFNPSCNFDLHDNLFEIEDYNGN